VSSPSGVWGEAPAEVEFDVAASGNNFNDFVLFFISEQHRKLKIKKSRGGNCLLLPQCSYAYGSHRIVS